MRRLTTLLLCLTTAALAEVPQERFLHQLTLESALPGEARWDSVQLVIEPETEGSLLFLQRRGLKGARGRVVVRSLAEPPIKDAVLPRHRADSWVLDFKEPVFIALFAEVERQFGPKPSAADLTAFAGAYVSKKSLGRNFDLASKVATTHEGDCSEHAVLLAALLRRYGFPARVMLGLVLVNLHGAPSVFGHAWVETFAKGSWKTVDAILPKSVEVRYLPSAELSDESAGFMLSLAPALQALRFKQLRLEPR